MDPVDIIFFDAGGTLLYPEPGVGEAYSRAGHRYGIRAGPVETELAFARAYSEAQVTSRYQDRGWWRDVVRRTFEQLGTCTDPESLFEELYFHFQSPEAWRLYPEVPEVLGKLRRRGYRTGLISNWDGRLPGLLEGLDVLSGLDPVVISHHVGVEKPSPLIYDRALNEAGVSPDRALMVGDDVEADIRGAHAAGMAAILIDWAGRHGDRPEAIRSLTDLLPRLPGRASNA